MKKNNKSIVGQPVRPFKKYSKEYIKVLKVLTSQLAENTKKILLPSLEANKSQYEDGFTSIVTSTLSELKNKIDVSLFARTLVNEKVRTAVNEHSQRFYGNIKRFTKIDFRMMAHEEDLEEFIQTKVASNISLIEDIPKQYYQEIERLVYDGVANGERYQDIADKILSKTKGLDTRAIRIATNEMQTLLSQVNLKRTTKLGITHGIYRTSEDKAVRPWHKELNGLTYELEKGAYSKIKKRYIQPGITDINCRCSYSPIINIDQIYSDNNI